MACNAFITTGKWSECCGICQQLDTCIPVWLMWYTSYRVLFALDNYCYSVQVTDTWYIVPMPVKYTMTSSNGNILRVTGPLCGEFSGHRWMPRTKAELWCFLWSAREQTVIGHIEDATALLCHLSTVALFINNIRIWPNRAINIRIYSENKYLCW